MFQGCVNFMSVNLSSFSRGFRWDALTISLFNRHLYYRKVPQFSDARKLCCNLPKIPTKRLNLLRVFCQKDAN